MSGSKARKRRRDIRRSTNRQPRSSRSQPQALAVLDRAVAACQETARRLTAEMTAITDPLDRNDVARLRDRAELTADDLAEVRIHMAATGHEVRLPVEGELESLRSLEATLRSGATGMESVAQLLELAQRTGALLRNAYRT